MKFQWSQGVRTFRGVRVCKGIYSVVLNMLNVLDRMQGPNYTGVIDVEDLMAQMQTQLNHGLITLSFGMNPLLTVYHSQRALVPHPMAALLPGPSQAGQPAPPQAPPPPPQSRKRPSQTDEGPGEKRKREETSPPRPAPASPLLSDMSDVEPTTPPVPPPPTAVRRPVTKRKMNITNRLECRLRTANQFVKPTRLRTDGERKQTAAYQEPLHPEWGVNGSCSNALEVCLPSPPPQPMNRSVTSCTRCHCELTRAATNDARQPAVCVLCGIYKERRVSTQFLFIKLALHCYSFCMFSLVICSIRILVVCSR